VISYSEVARAIEQTPVKICLFMYGEHREIVEVSDRISAADLRRRASMEFARRVLTVPEVFSVREWQW
jgi:hypothetical protein